MKKFLFTLASIIGLALAANAAAPVVYFTNGQNTDQITEATMAPGETMEFALCLVSMDENYKGSQHSFILVDPEGNIYSGWDKTTAQWGEVEIPDWGPVTMLQSEHSVPAIHLDFLESYGTADKFAWFGGVGKTVSGGTTVSNSNGANNQVTTYDADGEYMPGNEFGVPSEILYTGHYNMILTNGGAGTCYNKRGWTAANIIVFTVTTEEGWNDEYAEFKIDVTADHPADYVYPSGQVAGEAISLKIINSAASAPELEVPTIAVAGDGTLEATVTITNPNETGKIMYSLDNENWAEYTEALTFNEAGDYHIYAKVVDGDNESQVEDEEFTVRAETTAPEPAFREADGKLYAEKEGYTVNLQMMNGEGQWVDVANPYKLPAKTDEAQEIKFRAQTVKNTEDNNSDWVEYTVNIAALTYAPEPTIVETADGVVAQAPEGYTTVLMLDGVEVTQPYELAPAGNEEVVYHFSAYTVAKDEDNNSATVNRDITVAALQVQDLTGNLVISDCTQGLNGEGEGGYFTVTYDGPEAVTIVVTADAAAKATLEPNAEGKYRLPNYGTYNVKAVASAENYNDKEATKPLTWTQPASAPATEITVTKNDDGTVSIEANGNNPVIDGATTYPRPSFDEGDQTYTVTVTTTDEGCAPTTVDLTFTVPAMLQAPEIDAQEGKAEGTFDWIDGQQTNENLIVDGHFYDITITGHYDGTIMYSIDGGQTWQQYNGKITLSTNGTYDILAYEIKDGDKSEEAEKIVTIDDKTALNELVDGKAIANVRYFNMAGQEMQEANGITIVVTTYTDGTRSAVKVVK